MFLILANGASESTRGPGGQQMEGGVTPLVNTLDHVDCFWKALCEGW